MAAAPKNRAPRAARKASASDTVDVSARFGHPVLMPLHFDGVEYTPDGDALAFVTETEFDTLKAAQVFEGEWEDGALEAVVPSSEGQQSE